MDSNELLYRGAAGLRAIAGKRPDALLYLRESESDEVPEHISDIRVIAAIELRDFRADTEPQHCPLVPVGREIGYAERKRFHAAFCDYADLPNVRHEPRDL